MKRFEPLQTREAYVATQIERSRRKIGFCKVSARDVRRYHQLITRDRAGRGAAHASGPIACLGSRNGREVDLFRLGFCGPRWLFRMAAALERAHPSYASLCPALERVGRTDVARLSPTSVIGVEINPAAARADIWSGSFDEMPPGWTRRFGLLFSNSFDQALDPYRTAAEWKRVLRPDGYLIFCFAEGVEPTLSDPVGDLKLDDVRRLFGGEVVYHADRASAAGYSEVILRMDEHRG